MCNINNAGYLKEVIKPTSWGLNLVIDPILIQHTATVYFICGLNCSCMCYTQEQEQPCWSSSLHLVHHFNLTTPATLKFEIEVVKGEGNRLLQPGRIDKEPTVSIMIKGYLFI